MPYTMKPLSCDPGRIKDMADHQPPRAIFKALSDSNAK
jgi:hypothetical protein